MTRLTPPDRHLIANLAVVRAGMEAMNETIFADTDDMTDHTIERHNHQFLTALDMIRRIVPDHVLGWLPTVHPDDPPTRPVLTLITDDTDPAA